MNLEAIYIIVMDSIRKEIFDTKVVLEYNDFKKREEARRAVRNTLFGVVGRAQNKKNELKEEYE